MKPETIVCIPEDTEILGDEEGFLEDLRAGHCAVEWHRRMAEQHARLAAYEEGSLCFDGGGS